MAYRKLAYVIFEAVCSVAKNVYTFFAFAISGDQTKSNQERKLKG